MRVFDGLQEAVDFWLVSLSFQLDTTVRQVPDPAGHVITMRDFLNRKPEPHALNAALIDDALGSHLK